MKNMNDIEQVENRIFELEQTIDLIMEHLGVTIQKLGRYGELALVEAED